MGNYCFIEIYCKLGEDDLDAISCSFFLSSSFTLRFFIRFFFLFFKVFILIFIIIKVILLRLFIFITIELGFILISNNISIFVLLINDFNFGESGLKKSYFSKIVALKSGRSATGFLSTSISTKFSNGVNFSKVSMFLISFSFSKIWFSLGNSRRVSMLLLSPSLHKN